MLEQLVTVNFKSKPREAMNDVFLYTDYLGQIKDYDEIMIEPDVAFKYQGNFYGLLKYLNVEPKLFVLTLYVNRLNNPIDYKGEAGSIKIGRNLPIPKN